MSEVLKKIKEIDLEKLPFTPRLNYFTLRSTVERGVKHAIKPWQLVAEMPPETSENVLQGVYNVMVREYTDAIMEIIINEHMT
jgi:hypothetical protein